MARLEVDLTHRRGDFRLAAEFTTPEQGVTALFGPSGSGKSTLLHCIAGLLRGKGWVRLGKRCWQSDEARRFLPPHRRPLGFVFQDARLFPHLPVEGNLRFGQRRRGRHLPLEPVVELLGLAPLLQRRPGGLSGGEQRRVAIGRALLAAPELLLLDEPLAGLDAARKGEILPYLERLHRELAIPILFVSHELDEVTRLADHMVCMEAGRAVASGSLVELLARLDLPLAHAENATTLVEAVVAGHDEAYGLTHLDFRGGRLHVAQLPRRPGARARVRIHARDVSLALQRPQESSILNLLPATVVEIVDDGPVQVVVRLDAGGTALLSRITRKSAAVLELAPGKPLFAQIKSVALAD